MLSSMCMVSPTTMRITHSRVAQNRTTPSDGGAPLANRESTTSCA
jgi:hypothetical protein